MIICFTEFVWSLKKTRGVSQQSAVNLKRINSGLSHLKFKCVLLLMPTSSPAVIHMQCVSVSDPAYSNVNPLVCLTFQWCSGHLNSILCGCKSALRLSLSRWGLKRKSHEQLRQQQNKRVESEAHLASDRIYSKAALQPPPLPLFLSLAALGICFSDACGGLGDVSDLSLGRDAVSRQTAHQGEWQVLGAGTSHSLFCLEVESFNTKSFNRLFLDKSQRVMM